MGGCFSLPDLATEDPINGQPQQPGAARMAKSLCQSIRDFFMECLFSSWCIGGFGNSMVKTTWKFYPKATQNPDNKRSDPLGDAEKALKEVTAASKENKQRASDLIQRWELELIEAKLQKGADGNVVVGRKNDISLIKTRNPDNKISDLLGETKTSLDQEKPSNAKEVTTAINEQQNRAFALNPNAGTGVVGSEVVGNGADDSAVVRIV